MCFQLTPSEHRNFEQKLKIINTHPISQPTQLRNALLCAIRPSVDLNYIQISFSTVLCGSQFLVQTKLLLNVSTLEIYWIWNEFSQHNTKFIIKLICIWNILTFFFPLCFYTYFIRWWLTLWTVCWAFFLF